MAITKINYSQIKSAPINIMDYGATGNGTTNDTTAWLAFLAAVAVTGQRGYVPVGTYLVDPFSFDSTMSGMSLYGDSFNPASGTFGVPSTIIKCRTASAKFVTFAGTNDLRIDSISFDGNKISDAVLYFSGLTLNSPMNFAYCEFVGATPTTGIIHQYAGSIQGDSVTFYQCRIAESHNLIGSDKAANCIYNNNTNAFLITYENCYFASANVIARYGAGSCNLLNCQFYDITTGIILVDNATQPFTVDRGYTEGSASIYFFRQQGTAGVNYPYPIVLSKLQLNAADIDILCNCQQPVVITDSYISGNVQVTSYGGANGTHTVTARNLCFPAAKGFTGTDPLTYLENSGTEINTIQQPSKQTSAGVERIYVTGSVRSAVNSLATGVATPNVLDKNLCTIVNAAPQNVTDLTTNALNGQELIIYFGDGNTTLVQGATMKLQGSVNVTPTTGSIITLRCLSSVFYEVSRSIK